MPGHIMSAQQAVEEYGDQFKSLMKRGHDVIMKNSSGKKTEVSKNSKVYHRGHGKFAPYSRSLDEARHSKGARDKVGKGPYRHTKK